MIMVVGLVVGEGDDKGNADGMCQVVMQVIVKLWFGPLVLVIDIYIDPISPCVRKIR